MSNSKIPPSVLSELNRRINQELGAAYSYRALANWCDDQNLAGFTRWFSKQVGEEHIHAQKMIDFIIDRGTLPELSTLAAPKTTFKSLVEVARHVQAMEEKNTRRHQRCLRSRPPRQRLPDPDANAVVHY